MRDLQAKAECERRVELLKCEVVSPYDKRFELFSLSITLAAVLYWLAWAI